MGHQFFFHRFENFFLAARRERLAAGIQRRVHQVFRWTLVVQRGIRRTHDAVHDLVVLGNQRLPWTRRAYWRRPNADRGMGRNPSTSSAIGAKSGVYEGVSIRPWSGPVWPVKRHEYSKQ